MIHAAVLSVPAAALAVRLTLRDAHPWSAWVYYATPPPVIAAMFLVAALVPLVLGRWRVAIVAAIGAGLTLLVWLASSVRIHDCVTASDELRVLVWNASRKAHVSDAVSRIASAVRPFDPHIVGIVEAGPNADRYLAWWQAEFPDYTVLRPRKHLAILWKGDVERLAKRRLEGISHSVDVTGTIDGRRLHVVLVDLDASPRFDKRRLVADVFGAVGPVAPVASGAPGVSSGDGPTIVMGDFNTPLDSLAFRDVRGRFRHAFEAAGRGLPATWPSVFPLVAIDHVWLSSELQATCTTLVTQPGFDHRQVRVHIAGPR